MFEEGAGELIQEMESQRVKTDSTLCILHLTPPARTPFPVITKKSLQEEQSTELFTNSVCGKPQYFYRNQKPMKERDQQPRLCKMNFRM